MEERTLSVTDEQTIYIALGNDVATVRLYAFHGLMYCDIYFRKDDYLVAGQRVITGVWMMPTYTNKIYGNLRFESYDSDGDDYVWWEGFNTKFRLVTYTKEEMEQM